MVGKIPFFKCFSLGGGTSINFITVSLAGSMVGALCPKEPYGHGLLSWFAAVLLFLSRWPGSGSIERIASRIGNKLCC